MTIIPDNLTLFPYQKAGVKALVGKNRFMLRDSPGLGKTIQLIVSCNAVNPDNVLVLCPKSMVITWIREIKKWASHPEKFTVINHDKLITKDNYKILTSWDIVIADESHLYLKNIDTKRAAVFFSLIENARRVWLATATMASRSGEDYFCSLKVLLPDLMRKWSKSKFIKRYCKAVPDPFTYSGIKYVGFNNTVEMQTVLDKCSLSRKEEEVNLELPPLTFTDMYLEDHSEKFTPEEIKDIKKRVMEGKSFGNDYQGKMQKNALLKVPAVLELLSTYPPEKKVVIYAWHTAVIEELMNEAKKVEGRIVESITGKTESLGRQVVIDQFQSGSINTLILNMQAGGVGITLTAATAGIYVQFPYSAIHWVQSMKRIHRIGSKKPVQIIKLMSFRGIDKEIFDILDDRMKHIKEIEG